MFSKVLQEKYVHFVSVDQKAFWGGGGLHRYRHVLHFLIVGPLPWGLTHGRVQVLLAAVMNLDTFGCGNRNELLPLAVPKPRWGCTLWCVGSQGLGNHHHFWWLSCWVITAAARPPSANGTPSPFPGQRLTPPPAPGALLFACVKGRGI